jgi:uncharacterized protein (DUF433 family)
MVNRSLPPNGCHGILVAFMRGAMIQNMNELLSRITIDREICQGKLAEFLDLARADLRACLEIATHFRQI